MRIGRRYWLVVAAMCGLSMATVGLITNIAGLFFTPMADEFGVARGTASLGCSFSNAVFSSAVGYGYDLAGGYTVSLVAFLVFLVGSAAVVLWCYGRAGKKTE